MYLFVFTSGTKISTLKKYITKIERKRDCLLDEVPFILVISGKKISAALKQFIKKRDIVVCKIPGMILDFITNT